jgi:hypothetical protein
MTTEVMPGATGLAYTEPDGRKIHYNAKYFRPDGRGMLLQELHQVHLNGWLLGGSQYGAAPVAFHEGHHTVARDARFLDRNSKSAVSSLFKGYSFDPAVREGLGEYAGRDYAERWSMAGTMIGFFGTQAPYVAQEIWAQGVHMNADGWGAVDVQAANLRRSLDFLYAHTDPETGQELSPQAAAVRETAIAASRGLSPLWTPGQPLPPPNPVVHGIHAQPQQTRQRRHQSATEREFGGF